MPSITLDFAHLATPLALHAALKQALGFPDFYGANFAALVDCLSGLRFPEEGMCGVTLATEEVLQMHVLNLSSADDEVRDLLLCAVEDVNTREVQRGRLPPIALSLWRSEADRPDGVDPTLLAR